MNQEIKMQRNFIKMERRKAPGKFIIKMEKASRITLYQGDKKNGPYKEFFESGSPKIEAIMIDDEFDGIVKIYNPNGQVWQSGTYIKGLKEGSWMINKDDGTLEKEEIYKSGILTNPTADDK